MSIGRRSMRGLTKIGGRAVPVLILVGQGFLIREYQNGEISREEFWTSQSSLAGGFAGALGGAWAGTKAGATIGAWFGPGGAGIGGVIGGIAGGFAGGYAGSSAAEYGTHRHFQFKREEDERAFRDFVHRNYGLSHP